MNRRRSTSFTPCAPAAWVSGRFCCRPQRVETVVPQLGERGSDLGDGVGVGAVQAVAGVDAHVHQTELAQQLEVRARRRRAQPGGRRQLGRRALLVASRPQHRPPPGMPDGLDGVVELVVASRSPAHRPQQPVLRRRPSGDRHRRPDDPGLLARPRACRAGTSPPPRPRPRPRGRGPARSPQPGPTCARADPSPCPPPPRRPSTRTRPATCSDARARPAARKASRHVDTAAR